MRQKIFAQKKRKTTEKAKRRSFSEAKKLFLCLEFKSINTA
jgi:hypothetical protein